jgi:hypothetical protein
VVVLVLESDGACTSLNDHCARETEVLDLVCCYKARGDWEQDLWSYWVSEGCIKQRYDRASDCGCFCSECLKGEQWSSDLVSRTLAKHSYIRNGNAIFKSYDYQHWLESKFLYGFSGLWAFCQAALLLTYTVATSIGSYPELDPWNIIHILGFITPNFLPICLMIMLDLSIFLSWICVGVVMGKSLNDLGLRNILDTKLHGLGTCIHLAGWLFCCITVADWML